MAACKFSVAWQIFHVPWACQMTEIECYGVEYLREAGMLTTGDKTMDRELALSKRDLYLTIAAMVLNHDEGNTVILKNPVDSIEIYRLLREHLENWQWIINTQFNVDPPPAEDFIMMDNFAKAIHPLVLYAANGELPKTGLSKQLGAIQGKRGAFLAGRMRQRGTADNNKPAELSNDIYQPISGDIARRLWGQT